MRMSPLHIGPLRFDLPIALAPMAGLTHPPFRRLCRRHGCPLVFTEMISAEGIRRHQPRTLFYLETAPDERPLGAHLYGHDPDALAEAAAIAAATGRFDLIDINAGCPVARITRRGAGAALLRDPARLARIVAAVRQAVALPVTVKTRLGLAPGRGSLLEAAHALEEAGAAALFVHARYANARHSGPPNWSALAQIKAERKLPIIGNGGLSDVQSLETFFRETGADGAMIGRAAVGNPWLFSEIVAWHAGKPHRPISPADRRADIEEHLRGLAAQMEKEIRLRRRARRTSEDAANQVFRAHLVRYLSGCDGVKDLLRRVDEIRTTDELLAEIDRLGFG